MADSSVAACFICGRTGVELRRRRFQVMYYELEELICAAETARHRNGEVDAVKAKVLEIAGNRR